MGDRLERHPQRSAKSQRRTVVRGSAGIPDSLVNKLINTSGRVACIGILLFRVLIATIGALLNGEAIFGNDIRDTVGIGPLVSHQRRCQRKIVPGRDQAMLPQHRGHSGSPITTITHAELAAYTEAAMVRIDDQGLSFDSSGRLATSTSASSEGRGCNPDLLILDVIASGPVSLLPCKQGELLVSSGPAFG